MGYNDKIEQDNVNELAAAFTRFIPVLAGTSGMKSARFFTGIVTELTQEMEDNRVCSVKGVLDNEEIVYSDVNLSMERNDGFIEIPAIDSTVLVAKLPDGETYIVKCSDVSKIICVIDGSNDFTFDSNGFIFNGGTLDGMVKVNSLVTRLNNAENKLNSILNTFIAWIPVANDGGAALKVLLVPPVTTNVTTTVKADIENPKIKQ